MPSKKLETTTIGKHNDKALLEHLASPDFEQPLSFIEDKLDWNHKDKKGNPIKREQVQSRLTYLKNLQETNYQAFATLCLKVLQNEDLANIEPEQGQAKENQEPKATQKRSSNIQEEEINSNVPKKKARFNMAAGNNFNAALYGLPSDRTDYKQYNPNPYLNGEARIFQASEEIPSDTRTPNGATKKYSGFLVDTMIEIPYLFKNNQAPAKAWLLSPFLLCIEMPVSRTNFFDDDCTPLNCQLTCYFEMFSVGSLFHDV